MKSAVDQRNHLKINACKIGNIIKDEITQHQRNEYLNTNSADNCKVKEIQ